MADMEKKATPGFANQIQQAREAAGLSREGLAYKSGSSLRTIERIESGEVTPHRATIRAIAAALGVDPISFDAVPEKAA